jgi:hypothetical protein
MKLLADGDVKHPAKPCSNAAKLFTIETSCTIAPEITFGVVTASSQRSIGMDTYDVMPPAHVVLIAA